MQHLIRKLENVSTAVVLHTMIDFYVLLEMQIVTVLERKATSKVCLSKPTPPQNAAVSLTDSLIASSAGAPACLHCAVVDMVIQDAAARAVIDSGASDSCLNKGLAGKVNLPKLETQTKIGLASSRNTADASGYVEAEEQAFNHSYHLRLGVVKNLRADIILGQDFLKLHKSATF